MRQANKEASLLRLRVALNVDYRMDEGGDATLRMRVDAMEKVHDTQLNNRAPSM